MVLNAENSREGKKIFINLDSLLVLIYFFLFIWIPLYDYQKDTAMPPCTAKDGEAVWPAACEDELTLTQHGQLPAPQPFRIPGSTQAGSCFTSPFPREHGLNVSCHCATYESYPWKQNGPESHEH